MPKNGRNFLNIDKSQIICYAKLTDSRGGDEAMQSVYKVIEIIGTSDKSWEDAARTAVDTASKSIRDLRVAEVKELDMKVEDGKLIFRVKLNVSFKYEE
jgi:flavin-binding protein dodecin